MTSSAHSSSDGARRADFSEDTVALLQTFASQSALAIVNARLFRELEDKSDEAQVASRHKSEFLASMSHELRTPLNAVIGFSEVLLERMFGDINERQEEYLRDILDSGRHLLDLLNDILDLSKVEAGRMQLELHSFPLAPRLSTACRMVRERAVAHEITLDLHCAADWTSIEADELRFKQVVLNLLSNAVKFSPRAARRGRRRRDRRGRDRGHGRRQRRRHRGGGPRTNLRVLRAGRPRTEPERRAPVSGSRCAGGSSTCSGDGCGWRASWASGSTFGFAIPVRSRSRRTVGTRRLAIGDQPVVVVIEDDRRSLELLSLYLEDAGVRS